jgi:riboflavin synthase
MFTGIIEEIGTIKSIQHGPKSAVLDIQASKVLENTILGDSISTNGVCLTVVEQTENSFRVEAMNETLARTNLGSLTQGARVNLERALALGDRLGGHMVSGHIDGTGVIQAMRQDDIAWWVTITCDDKLMRYIIEKGSIAIDGISLTVARVEPQAFEVSIIPHTKDHTTLLSKSIGDTVNLENDLVGKYIERFTMGQTSSMSLDDLAKKGY